MPYVTSIERMAKEEAQREGLLDTIQVVLKLKFGKPGLQLMSKIHKMDDLGALKAIRKAVETADALDQVQALLRTQPP